MIYRIKWVEKTLGITRDTIVYYEDAKLISKQAYENPNTKYREYDERGIATIWGIKLLRDIGYSTSEVRKIIKNEYDFYSTLDLKIKELEQDYNQKKRCYEFMRTIKLMGRIPMVNEFGSILFDDFLKFAMENWNFYSEPELAKCLNVFDKAVSDNAEDITLSDLENMRELFSNTERMMNLYNLNAYFKLLSELQDLDSDSKAVQKVVGLLYDCFCQQFVDDELKEIPSPMSFAKHMIPNFMYGEVATANKANYGASGCEFIIKAITCFGGLENNNNKGRF